jgi:glucose 1-dehydrogenase
VGWRSIVIEFPPKIERRWTAGVSSWHRTEIVGVGPGAVATPIYAATVRDPVLLKKLNDAIPLGRMARPEEIASVAAFLADDGASYMTAAIIADDGLMQSARVSRGRPPIRSR